MRAKPGRLAACAPSSGSLEMLLRALVIALAACGVAAAAPAADDVALPLAGVEPLGEERAAQLLGETVALLQLAT